MKLLLFCTVTVIMTCGSADWPVSTPAPGGQDLTGKMFTLSPNGRLVLYSPYLLGSTTTTASRTTTRVPYRTTTTQPTTTRVPYQTTTTQPTTTRAPYRTTTRAPYRTTTRAPYRTTTRAPYRTTTTQPTTTRAPYRTTTRAPYRTTTTRPTTTRAPYRTTTRAPYRTTTIRPTTTRAPYRTTTQAPPTPPWTTASPTRGVSVCLRYATDQQRVSVFTLNPSRSPLSLTISGPSSYELSFNGYGSVFLKTSVFWSDVRRNIWTSMCLTVDTRSGVTQMFRDSTMSIRKVMPYRYSWSGQPVIDFSGFEGQVSDVQVWDYPLSFKEVFYFMTFYSPRQGSALSWSYIKFSVSGETVLEDSYERQMKQPMGRKERGLRLKWDQSPRKDLNKERSRWF